MNRHRNQILTVLFCALLIILAMLICARWNLVLAEAEQSETGKPQQTTQEREPLEVIVTREIVHKQVYVPMKVDYPTVPEKDISEEDAVLLAKTLWGEYRNAKNYNQCAAVCWCILNRVDSDSFGNTIREVVTAPAQFQGYSAGNPIDADLYAIAVDVLTRHKMEDVCIGSVGRILPKEFCWFEGNGSVNIFRNAYTGGERITP